MPIKTDSLALNEDFLRKIVDGTVHNFGTNLKVVIGYETNVSGMKLMHCMLHRFSDYGVKVVLTANPNRWMLAEAVISSESSIAFFLSEDIRRVYFLNHLGREVSGSWIKSIIGGHYDDTIKQLGHNDHKSVECLSFFNDYLDSVYGPISDLSCAQKYFFDIDCSFDYTSSNYMKDIAAKIGLQKYSIKSYKPFSFNAVGRKYISVNKKIKDLANKSSAKLNKVSVLFLPNGKGVNVAYYGVGWLNTLTIAVLSILMMHERKMVPSIWYCGFAVNSFVVNFLAQKGIKLYFSTVKNFYGYSAFIGNDHSLSLRKNNYKIDSFHSAIMSVQAIDHFSISKFQLDSLNRAVLVH